MLISFFVTLKFVFIFSSFVGIKFMFIFTPFIVLNSELISSSLVLKFVLYRELLLYKMKRHKELLSRKAVKSTRSNFF